MPADASKPPKRRKAAKAPGKPQRKNPFHFKDTLRPDDDPHLAKERAKMAAKMRMMAEFTPEELVALQVKLERWIKERSYGT